MTPPLRVVFLGSPAFALPALRALVTRTSPPCEVLVVTQPDRPTGRGRERASPPVKVEALTHGLPVLQPERLRGNDALLAELRAFAPDLLVVAAYGRILGPEYLALPRLLPLNLHGSLLPAFRGASPIHAAILEGAPETGITLMRMDTGCDTGDVLDAPYAAPRVAVSDDATTASLTPVLAELAAQALDQFLDDVARETPLSFRSQGETPTPVTHPLTKEDGHLRFAEEDAARLARRVRAMDPWPVAWATWGKLPLRVWRARAVASSAPAVPGTVLPLPDGSCAVGTARGLLVPTELQVAGKKRLPIDAFLRGARGFVGSVLH